MTANDYIFKALYFFGIMCTYLLFTIRAGTCKYKENKIGSVSVLNLLNFNHNTLQTIIIVFFVSFCF